MYDSDKAMVQMLFFIRFRAQLRRTRPELIVSLEDAIAKAASAAGGAVETGHKILSSVFDEKRIGFWLDIALFLEKAHKAIGDAARELYGYSLVVGNDIPEMSSRKLCRSLSSAGAPKGTGIWCSQEIRETLEFYMTFCRASAGVPLLYRELKEFRSFDGPVQGYPYREKIERTLAMSPDKNTMLLGEESADLRDGVYRYASGLLGDIPPLVIGFGAGGSGLICFADAYTPSIREFTAGVSAELEPIHAVLFKERLRYEWSSYVKDLSRSFIQSLLVSYTAAARKAAAKSAEVNGLLILENLSFADASVIDVFRSIYLSLDENKRPVILAIDNASEDTLRSFTGLFSRILKFAPEDFAVQEKSRLSKNILLNIPRDLRELSYNISLLGRYFPSYLFPQLMEEEGLNRDIYFRTVKILETLGVFVPGDSRPQIPNFILQAEEILGNQREMVRTAVRSRILAWALSGMVRPCFNLLKILSELGEQAGDMLVLRSIRADILNGTYRGIEEANASGRFAALVGEKNAQALVFIYRTFKALAWGTNRETQQVFMEPVPPMILDDGTPCYEGYRAQVQANLAAFYIGSRNIEAASEALRKAMLLNQDLGEDAVPAFRLFSLVNLSRQRLDDALEYNSFALDHAEKTRQYEELAVVCYYAASINLLYGNLSKAERLAVRAEETAAELGLARWGERAKFLRGRLCFETGRYRSALEIFETFGVMADGGNFYGNSAPELSEMARTVKAWISRTRVFMDRFPLENLAGLDAEIFRIEAAYFAGDYQKTVSLAGNFLSSVSEISKTDFLFTEQPDWRSGFCQCEYLFQSDKVPGIRMAWVYRAMAQCALNPTQEMKDEILGGMQRFMRDELLPDTDPNDMFYFYAWYCMLRDTGSAQVDMNTVVSMAYKRLQRRAGRIDDIAVKQDYLSLPRWNKTLSLAAKEHKFI